MNNVRRFTIVGIAFVCIIAASLWASGVTAADEKPCDPTKSLCYTPNVEIPGLFTGTKTVDETLFGTYVSSFYIFFAGVAGILAVVMIMWGGFHYITSLGNPQRMKEGKDIINNAIVGLILVLTSYLLLRTINPRLTTLILPPVGYYGAIYQTDIYCEAHNKVNGDTLATDAAKEKGKYCTTEGQTAEQLTVEYTNKNGAKQTCVSFAITDKVLSEQKAIANEENGWQKQLVCFPAKEVKTDPTTGAATSKYLYALRQVGDTSGVCEKNEITSDTECSYAQKLLDLAGGSYLIGACKKSNVYATLTTGHDVCHYYEKLHCPTTTSVQVSCRIAGAGVTSKCWDGKGAQFITDPTGGNLRSYCVEPTVKPIVEHVDAVCCQNDVKDMIICAPTITDELNRAPSDFGYFEVPCSKYMNPETASMKFASYTMFKAPPKAQDPIPRFILNRGGYSDTSCPLPLKCWTTVNLYNTNQ